eukprot:gnl/MRDRNA2_/MRDRNA2_35967_c0_seq1.p1 gnl/MRDRNA2_/MRDRNA2_35967_c0~~gnl/MRDRNA2_/MRDRNA2_35967_c0_seq1.p1  ORF type:complete len:977 (+),score=158.88 gnl/MRDRNA2_/MRDRNA2_35967_c0_seq1:101-3031(+)
MSAEDDDDDNEKGLDDDPDSIDTREQGKAKILSLLRERQRKLDYMRRLEKKLRALDADLAEMREAVEMKQRTLEIERNKPKQEADSRKREKESKVHNQKERVRDLLGDVLYSKPKQKAETAKEFDLDTVLVSFIRPGEQFRYNLAYRVDSETQIRQLCGDVCKYWGVSDEEYILKTMSNNKCQNDIKVKDCFKQGEIAQLLLIRKNTKNMIVSESERKAIQPKGGGRKKKAGGGKIDLDRVDAIGLRGNFDGELKKMSGIYMLLKLRDLKPSEHANKIKLRDIILFTTLAILTMVSYVSRRPPTQEFLLVEGVKAEMLPPRMDPDTGLSAPAFSQVTTIDHVWQWLTTTMPLGLYANASVLRKYNSLVGFVQIRQQSVGFPPTRVGFCHADVAPLMESLQTLGNVGTPLRQPTCDDYQSTSGGIKCPNLNPAGSPSIPVRIERVNRGTSFRVTREAAEKGEQLDMDFDGPATVTVSMLEVGPGILSLSRQNENGVRFYYNQKAVNELQGAMPDPIDIPPGKYNLQWNAMNVTNYDAFQGFTVTIAPTGPRCFAQVYDSSTADTMMYGSLKDYWSSRDANEQGGEARGPSNPGVYEDADSNRIKRRISNIVGYNQEYDASGFSADYKLQVMDLYHSKEVVIHDMQKFKEMLWFSIRTRLVVVSFSLYNFQYDKWCAVDMLFELPPSGIVRTTYMIRPFKPTLEETKDEMNEVYIDYIRCLIGFFIAVFIRADEIKHKEKNHKGGYQYITSLNGISDVIIIVTVIIITIIRKVAFATQTTPEWVNQLNTNSGGFISLSTEAYVHEQVQVIEGILFLANMARILSFLRLNHKVFMLWHTIGEALKMFVYFCMLFFPIFVGFCILAHSIWAPYTEGFDTVSETMLSLLEFMKGNLEYESMSHNDQVWSAVFFLLFFLIISFCLLNIFTAILIDSYYVVALTAGFDPKEFQWKTSKWLSWACPSLFFNFIMELQRPATDTG